ncbi:MAG: protein kinase [Solirubrobacterales bacterium]
MSLSAGHRLGPYEILSPLGAGGMGEVYRARDTRLGREVAIKVLPADRLTDESRRRRFVLEARAASALNHPHIVTIHEIESVDGVDFIVMEYVQGKTLDALLRPGMRLTEVIRVAISIADALAHAHAAGIVHRDLKPANVVVTPDGVAKILDFGLVKLMAVEETSGEEDTLTGVSAERFMSRPGAISGTPGYMSPEQATGGKVDTRSDIFSFGCLLYEMVTGRPAFAGGSRAQTLAAVLGTQPKPPGEIAPNVSKDLEKLMLRCLQKEPEKRFQHMGDVKVLLQEIREESDARPAAPAAAPKRRLRRLAAVLAIALLLAAAWLLRPTHESALPPPQVVSLTTIGGSEWTPALSPDGEQVAFSWEGEGATPNRDIWLKLIGGSEARRLTSDPAADVFPSWSPDSRQIAFIRSPGQRVDLPFPPRTTGGAIHIVSPLGGPDRKLSAAPAALSQLAWSPDGRWLAAALLTKDGGQASRIYLVPEQAGEPLAITAPTPPGFDVHPAFSPDGRRLAYASCAGGIYPPCEVYVVDLGADFRPRGPARQRLTRKAPYPISGLAWTRDGRSLVYSTAYALDFYLWRVGAEGDSPPERVELAGRGAYYPATVASKGRLAFAQSLRNTDIYRFGAGRPATAVVVSSYDDFGPSFSPDGRRIAFESGRSGEVHDIWLAEADGSNPVQLTRGPGIWQGSPHWSPDGRRIVFNSEGEDGYADVWTIDVGGGSLRRVTSGPLREGLGFWSRDGRWIYYRGDRPDGHDIYRIPDAGGQAERLTHDGGLWACESADGKTLFYTKRDDTSPLFSLPLGGGPERRVVECVLSRSLADGPDGIYYLGCPAEQHGAPLQGQREAPLYRLDPATGRSRLLGTLEPGGLRELAVSPDGKTILFTKIAAEGADLILIENFR